MVNEQDNTNNEIRTMAHHKYEANGQDNIKIMNGGDVTHVRDDEHRIQAHKEMANNQDNTNDEIRTMAHKCEANGQDKTKMMNGGDVTHVRDDEHGM